MLIRPPSPGTAVKMLLTDSYRYCRQFREAGRRREVGAPGAGLDAERVDPDPVSRRGRHRSPQFRQAPLAIPPRLGCERRGAQVAELDGEPEAVHALVRQAVQVLGRVVVDVVHQLVAHLRRAFDGPEEATRDPTAYEGAPLDGTPSKHGPARAAHLVLEEHERPPDALGVAGAHRARVLGDLDPVGLGHVHVGAPRHDRVRPVPPNGGRFEEAVEVLVRGVEDSVTVFESPHDRDPVAEERLVVTGVMPGEADLLVERRAQVVDERPG